MRWLLTLILIPLALQLLSGCGSSATPVLDRAEALMESHPDSALALLQALPSSRLSRSSDRARHALLLTQAKDKNYIDVADDSLISIADRYYRRSASDPRRRMLSAFYHGRVCFNASDYPRALQLFSESLDLAAALPDTFWMARSASEKAAIYRVNSRFKDELYYAESAYKLHQHVKVQPQWNYAILDLGTAYLNIGNYDKALTLTIPLIDSARIYSNPELHEFASVTIAKALYSVGQYTRAIDMLENIESASSCQDDITCILGKSFIYSGRLNKADSIASQYNVTESYNPILLSFASELAKAHKDINKATYLTEKLLHSNDSMLVEALEQNFAQGLDEYHQHIIEIHNLNLSKTRQHISFTIITCILIIIAVSALFFQKYRSQRILLSTQVNEIHNITNLLDLNTSSNTKLQATINELLSSRFKILDSLCRTYYEHQATSVLHKRIGESLHDIISGFYADSPKKTELIRMVNHTYNNVYADFHREFPSLKEADYMLFLYCALGFSSPTIALFLKEENVTSVYYRKKRLKTKIRQTDSSNSRRYLDILS